MFRPWLIRAGTPPDRYCAWRGSSLLVVDAQGNASPEKLTGFFFRETRYLSRLELRLNGELPFCCSGAQINANRLEFTYVYPPLDIGAGGGSGSGGQSAWKGILRRGIDLRLVYEVHASYLDITAHVTSRWDEMVELSVEWELDSDYADMPQVQGGHREDTFITSALAAEDSAMRFRYTHPQLPFETLVASEPASEVSTDQRRLRQSLALRRQQPCVLRLRVEAVDFENAIRRDQALERDAVLDQWAENTVYVTSPGESLVASIVDRAVRDFGSFALLEGERDEWLTPAAGVPLYLALWGRDALTAGWQGALFDSGEMATAALVRIGRMQGVKIDSAHDEEPGRIIQQARSGPLDRLGKSPFARYYADQASPFDFVFALAHAFACRGELGEVRKHWDMCRRIIDWASMWGDRDGDGFIEYQTAAPGGPRHQGWKDSDNAMVHADGRQADTPLAACEVQGYYFAALQVMAALSGLLGHPVDSLAFWRAAEALKTRFNEAFWMEDEGFIALGLDSEKRQLRSVTSNAGQCLATGIIAEQNMPRVVRRLFERDLFSGWGIRTLSANNPSWNPLDYHLGSVWLIENATIVFGLRRFGFDDRALELARALFDLAAMWPANRVPECVGGYSRDEFGHPGAYPRANAPQMWNESAWLLILQTIAGLQPLAPLSTLAVDPVLPEWLPDITLHRIRVGRASVTLRFHRQRDGTTETQILNKEGTLHIVHQPSPNSLRAGAWDRLKALFDRPINV